MASTLTAGQIVAIYPADNSVTKEQAEVYLPYLVEACREHDITDKNRVAGFLGQLGEESGELVYFEELWGPSEAQSGYEGRADLGNTEPGDGYYFRGSGPIQITGRHNTTRVCDALGLPVDPDLLRQPKDGFRAAAYFWTNMGNDYYDKSNNGATNMNRFADAGDIDAMTYGVNGGFTNYDNRVWYYNKAMEVLPDDLDLSGDELEADEAKGDEVENWDWPVANDPVVFDGTYVGAHPTRYDEVWRPDVEQVARRMVNTYGCWANTYYDHPTGWETDAVSIDFWAYAGRGEPIGHELGQQVFDAIFNDPNPPWIRWCIWEGWIWIDGVGWQAFVDDGTGAHYDHPHFTFH